MASPVDSKSKSDQGFSLVEIRSFTIIQRAVLSPPKLWHLPFSVQLWIRKDRLHHASTVRRRIRVVRSHNGTQLCSDVVEVLGVLGHNGQITHTLIVETEVLGETLRADHLNASGDEVTHRKCVLIQITAGEAFGKRNRFVISLLD